MKTGAIRGNAAAYCRVPPCKPPRRLFPGHAGNALARNGGSKNSAYAGARGAHRLAWRPGSVALIAKCGESLQRGFLIHLFVWSASALMTTRILAYVTIEVFWTAMDCLMRNQSLQPTFKSTTENARLPWSSPSFAESGSARACCSASWKTE